MFRYHKSLSYLVLLAVIDSTISAQVSGIQDLVGEKNNDADPHKHLRGCRPHTPGYVSPYASLKPDDIPSIMGGTACINGFAGGFACKNIDLEAFIDLAAFGSPDLANDIWGWTDSQTEKEYALVGLSDGTAFVDISNPSNPVYLGKLRTHSSESTWRDIKTYADHAFIVSEADSHGMQVFDLTQLRNVNEPPQTFSETAHLDSFGNAHNIVMNEETGLAIAVGSNQCRGGLYMIDVTDPSNPTNSGCYHSDGYTHDAQCVIYHGPTETYQGREICFAANEDTITIVDVTNRESPVLLERKGYSDSEYAHQGWLTEDHTTFLANDELDKYNDNHGRTYIWDVSDLTNIALKRIHTAPTRKSIMHNEYVKGNFVYQSNYEAGLTILDVSNAANGELEDVAFFDMTSRGNGKGWDGSWSNYPYFKSGIVITTGIEQGLFILRPNLADLTSAPVAAPTTEPPVFVRIDSFNVKTRGVINLKSALQFELRSTDDVKANNAVITVAVSSSVGSKNEEIEICKTRRGKCTIRLPTYKADDPPVIVELKSIQSDLGDYNSDLNTEYQGCPVFSSTCPTVTIENVKFVY